MKKHIMVLDLLFYVAIPLVVWNLGRDYMGDYYAMLSSSIPGILYSIYRFYEIRKVNFTGIFILSTLVIGTLLDFLAGSAIQLLWNNVYYSIGMALFFVMSILINKPAALFLSLDLVELQGNDRKSMKDLFYDKKVLMIFKLITLLFACRESVLTVIRVLLIHKYGVDAFDQGIVYRQIISWGFTFISMFGFLYIAKIINNMKPVD
ncbi:VC0807 family protein [Peribacillus sp. SCS-155]|uniref:VC0807 family protein n=1 Tax=Peribacillus sedimenti TaxID=3115297 RepID=UPI0039060893